METFLKLRRDKLNPPKEPTESFAGKTVLVTGANSGLGYEAAIKYVTLGADKVILGVRSTSKGAGAKSAIELQTKRSKCVEVWQLDMLDYNSIQAFANRASKLDRLDIAVLNAGVVARKFEASTYGWERTLQVNSLSTVLLALLLMPKLRDSKTASFTPVLELVSSNLHAMLSLTDQQRAAKDPLELFNQASNYAANKQYAVSKLFLMCALPYLANKATSGVDKPASYVTTVDPGFCQSDLGRDFMHWYVKPLLPLVSLIQRKASEGARSYVSGSLLGEKGHGAFWMHDELQPTAPLLKGEEGQQRIERVWHEILDALRKDVPHFDEIENA